MVALNVGLRVAAFAGRDRWLAIGLLLPVAWAGVWTGNRVHMGVAHEFSVSSLLVWMSIEARRIHRMQYEYVATYRLVLSFAFAQERTSASASSRRRWATPFG